MSVATWIDPAFIATIDTLWANDHGGATPGETTQAILDSFKLRQISTRILDDQDGVAPEFYGLVSDSMPSKKVAARSTTLASVDEALANDEALLAIYYKYEQRIQGQLAMGLGVND